MVKNKRSNVNRTVSPKDRDTFSKTISTSKHNSNNAHKL